MSNVTVTHLSEWKLFLSPLPLLLLMPGLLQGLLIYWLLRTFRSPFVLPICLGCILVTFYAILYLTNTPLDDARTFGWVSPLPSNEQPSSLLASLSLYEFNKVEWHLLPDQFPTWLGMFFVVAFSSSLDVAAIEMELGLPLDYNKELQTVGISNACSGLLGGFTGSYIFSQTLFTMRRGVTSRICGVLVAVIELLLCVLPIPVTSYCPKMFFGCLLVFIGVDLMFEVSGMYI